MFTHYLLLYHYSPLQTHEFSFHHNDEGCQSNDLLHLFFTLQPFPLLILFFPVPKNESALSNRCRLFCLKLHLKKIGQKKSIMAYFLNSSFPFCLALACEAVSTSLLKIVCCLSLLFLYHSLEQTSIFSQNEQTRCFYCHLCPCGLCLCLLYQC